jgi:hypothetical protein
MKHPGAALNTALLITLGMLAACATSPTATEPQAAATEATPDESRPKWSMASEEEVAAKLDLEFEKAAKGYVKLKKDGVLMFCKRYKTIGSNIATIQCITEAELRQQVENMTRYRDDMRNKAGKCTHGVGCQS